jgi:hypothetical protein
MYAALMKPADICNTILGTKKLETILDELTTPQVKAILKEGDIKVKLPGGYVPQQKRRHLWSTKITAGILEGNHDAAAELLQQWLLNHRRPLLMDYLNKLEVRHRQGETDESFLVTRSAEKIREAAQWLLGQYDPVEVNAYLTYIAYQQRAKVFADWEVLTSGQGYQETTSEENLAVATNIPEGA